MSGIEEITKGYDPEALEKSFKRLIKNQRQKDQEKRLAAHTGEIEVAAPSTPHLIDFDSAKNPFWRSYKITLKKKPILTENNIEVLEGLIRWIIKDSTGEYDIQKGLFIYGAYGTGKTDLLHSLKHFSIKLNLSNNRYDNVRKLPQIQSYKFMIQKAKESKSIAGLYKKDGPSIIDDLGFKNETQLKIFGEKTNVIDEIIESRHRAWRANRNHYSIFTSNLDVEDIHEVHGEGISSRLIEMCNIILWDGENFRLK